MSKIRAACIIIGDEVLNGKVTDVNSTFFAKFCFNNGIELKEIATVGDEENHIIETTQRLAKKYQFIITTGGIGPTHDDITYQSIAKSFNLPCLLNEEVKAKMMLRSKSVNKLTEKQLLDHYRMATVPTGPQVKNYFVSDDLWVPVCSIDHKVYIFPGIPQLFQRMLTGFLPMIKKIYNLKENDSSYLRFYVKTHQTESMIAQYLRELQIEASKISEDIKIGSYPHFGMGFNTVSILGSNSQEEYLRLITQRTIEKLDGEQITAKQEEEYSNQQ
ncbi:hypothetical protein TBLA_0A05980 [Henningerozyma blattae CBS 6284]|uniref:MoaB/Mog domain-containing protein n=1 Tax=Henningerozyma blattae (strain ATCC 34711 / CBS 6284 / DSM 70876 / NBRC 10599 / NRRL Y-10934 / UCD 77-7) TaxID=1071380 RepID=I2GW89_HENB6|nr:hypothetical protein TBLA_0A05980 [Tetrapisispora blattae CBS 6284]CCH58391.1 hypothetical protein TBLA_0A05980 [Tetrapisispora blattae CBS 6284]